ncbi:MAG TPA: cytochrome c family protein [Allosphingosinicella sp.]|nr:cytochrome c family protein [Allosphingosinicella sp.]
MDGRFNTIAGWVLGAGIVFLGANLVTKEVFKAHHSNEFGYPVNGGEAASDSGPAEQPIAFYLQTADAARGQRSFSKCQGCHTIAQGGANGTGPNLWGVMGEPIGAGHAGFNFSDALRTKGGTWTWDAMSAWLANPRAFAPGTRMGFGGISNPQERADLLLYLNQQGGHLTVPPPPAAEPAGGNESAGNEAAPAGNASAGNEAAAAGNAAAPAGNAAAPAGNAQ